MRIALLTDGIYPYRIGGMQTHSFYMAAYFARNKVAVDLYHPEIETDQQSFMSCFSEEERECITVILVKEYKTIYFPGHYLLESYRYSKSIYELYIQRPAVDFIYAQGFTAWFFLKKKEEERKTFPAIGVNFHGLNMFQPAFGIRNKFNNLLFRKPVRFNLRGADVVFSLGKQLSRLLNENGIPFDKIVEIPVGIADSWLNDKNTIRNNDVLTFLFVGRYDKVKGIEMINDSIQGLNRQGMKFKFDFIGAIPDDKKVNAKNVHYHGEIRDQQVLQSQIRQADVLVSASFSEGMPTVILEAMACGLAVITTDVGEVKELVSSENGYVIEPGSAAALLQCMKQLIELDKNALLQLKTSGARKVRERFGWDRIINQTIREIARQIH